MSAKKKSGGSDFRYETGAARIPWAAVGESLRHQDVLDIVQFLVPAEEGREEPYERALANVSQAVNVLQQFGHPATKLTLGEKVKELETKACELLRAKHAVFLTNATAGFEIAYKFAGLKPGDEVIAPAITFIATIAYPLSIGAKVVLADVDPRTINMDPEDVARKITPRTKVIIPVHIGGYPVDMDPIMELAGANDITVIEDAAHGFGGEYKGKMLGTVGHFGSFSFHEVKNITSLGEGGILVSDTNYGQDFAKARFLGLDLSLTIKNWLYDVIALEGKDGPFAPGNHSATEIQALSLIRQMERLATIIAERRKAAEYLTERFTGIDGLIPQLTDTDEIKSTYHLYLLQVDPEKAGGDVQEFKERLQARGVVNIPHFGPLYKFSIMRQLGYDTEAIEAGCPATEEVFNRRFTHLPLYQFTQNDLEFMADTVIDVIGEMKKGS